MIFYDLWEHQTYATFYKNRQQSLYHIRHKVVATSSKNDPIDTDPNGLNIMKQNHKCLACADHQMLLETILHQDEYILWYQYAGNCISCQQRALTYVLQCDDIVMLDRMFRWTNSFEHIMEIFLAACVYDKPNIVNWMLYLWNTGLFCKGDLVRIFCDHCFLSDMEHNLMQEMSMYVEVYSQCIMDIAGVMGVDANKLYKTIAKM